MSEPIFLGCSTPEQDDRLLETIRKVREQMTKPKLTPEREAELREIAIRHFAEPSTLGSLLDEIDRLRAELGEVKRHWAEDTRDIDEIAATLAARDAELARLRNGIQEAIYDCGNCRGNYPGNCPACQPLASLLPPTPKEG